MGIQITNTHRNSWISCLTTEKKSNSNRRPANSLCVFVCACVCVCLYCCGRSEYAKISVNSTKLCTNRRTVYTFSIGKFATLISSPDFVQSPESCNHKYLFCCFVFGNSGRSATTGRQKYEKYLHFFFYIYKFLNARRTLITSRRPTSRSVEDIFKKRNWIRTRKTRRKQKSI